MRSEHGVLHNGTMGLRAPCDRPEHREVLLVRAIGTSTSARYSARLQA